MGTPLQGGSRHPASIPWRNSVGPWRIASLMATSTINEVGPDRGAGTFGRLNSGQKCCPLRLRYAYRMILDNPEVLARAVQDALAENAVLLLGVCGLPGAGKTTLCKEMLQTFPGAVFHFICDRFSKYAYVERERRIAAAIASGCPMDIEAEENPCRWYDWDGIGVALRDLREKRMFVYPFGWNRQSGERDEPYEGRIAGSGPALVLCDGIYLLHSPVRSWFDRVLLVDASLDQTLERGRNRGQSQGEPGRAARMERLTLTYAVPYFAEHAQRADWVYRPDRACLR
jgi:uridine kinase